tara:strand:+ start:443 stop:592 length:150 start_codon:yes stop_codon:yes gene_type:complete
VPVPQLAQKGVHEEIETSLADSVPLSTTIGDLGYSGNEFVRRRVPLVPK